ncbi:MAG: type II secretion system F family protein [Planctomycetales bacterium]|nr:type II secretion system F family protein [Planctomycetales bacterium]
MPTDTLTLPPLTPMPEFSDILRDRETFGTGQSGKLADRVNNSFDRLLLQSGQGVSAATVLMLSMLGGLVLGGTMFVIQENFLSTALATAAGFLLPYGWLSSSVSRRQRKMLDQMPGMVEEMARAAKTGRSIEQCFALVAQDTPAPLGDELRLSLKRLELGVGLRVALDELPERTGLVSLSIFSMALAVHLSSGGDLVSVLERLSHTIRERIAFIGRLRAATSASRATAVLMVVLPPLIFGFFVVRDPDYLTELMSSSWGWGLTMFAIALDVIGVTFVLSILRSSQRS